MHSCLGLVLLLFFASSSALAQSTAPGSFKGFLCCNMHTDGKWISDLNDAEGAQRMIPLGTPIEVTGYGRQRVLLRLPDGAQTLGNDYSRDLELPNFARRYVVTDDPKRRLATYPESMRTAIEASKLLIGMTRDQAAMSLGYPVVRDTSSLEAGMWRYKRGERRFLLLWDEVGQLKDVAATTPTRGDVLMDADRHAPGADGVDFLRMEIAREEDPDLPAQTAWLHSGLAGNPWVFLDRSTDCGVRIFRHSLGRPLFGRGTSRAMEDGSVLVPAGEPIRLTYHDTHGSEYCTLTVETQLQPGKRYTVVGASNMTGHASAFFKTGDGCSLGLRDDETEEQVKVVAYRQGQLCAGKP